MQLISVSEQAELTMRQCASLCARQDPAQGCGIGHVDRPIVAESFVGVKLLACWQPLLYNLRETITYAPGYRHIAIAAARARVEKSGFAPQACFIGVGPVCLFALSCFALLSVCPCRGLSVTPASLKPRWL